MKISCVSRRTRWAFFRVTDWKIIFTNTYLDPLSIVVWLLHLIGVFFVRISSLIFIWKLPLIVILPAQECYFAVFEPSIYYCLIAILIQQICFRCNCCWSLWRPFTTRYATDLITKRWLENLILCHQSLKFWKKKVSSELLVNLQEGKIWQLH